MGYGWGVRGTKMVMIGLLMNLRVVPKKKHLRSSSQQNIAVDEISRTIKDIVEWNFNRGIFQGA